MRTRFRCRGQISNLTGEKTKLLSDFLVGEAGVVSAVAGEGKIRRRLFDMGVTPGAEIYLRKTAPLGDPLEITIRDYELTLRKNEARLITVCLMNEVKRKGRP
ncbi:MAG: FeoA family protein [Bacilli bacterium]|jgi:Fe2+ transport system protein FeoA